MDKHSTVPEQLATSTTAITQSALTPPVFSNTPSFPGANPMSSVSNSQVINTATDQRQQLRGVSFPCAAFSGCNFNFYLASEK